MMLISTPSQAFAATRDALLRKLISGEIQAPEAGAAVEGAV